MRLFLKWYIDNLCPKTKTRPFYFRSRIDSGICFPVVGQELFQTKVG